MSGVRSSWEASARNRRSRSSDAARRREGPLDLGEHGVERRRRAGPPRCGGRCSAPAGTGRPRRSPPPWRPSRRADAARAGRSTRPGARGRRAPPPETSTSMRSRRSRVWSTSVRGMATTTMPRTPSADEGSAQHPVGHGGRRRRSVASNRPVASTRPARARQRQGQERRRPAGRAVGSGPGRCRSGRAPGPAGPRAAPTRSRRRPKGRALGWSAHLRADRGRRRPGAAGRPVRRDTTAARRRWPRRPTTSPTATMPDEDEQQAEPQGHGPTPAGGAGSSPHPGRCG